MLPHGHLKSEGAAQLQTNEVSMAEDELSLLHYTTFVCLFGVLAHTN